MRLGVRLAALVLCASTLGACDVGNGYGSVDGSLFIRQCAPHTAIGATAEEGTAYSFGSAAAPLGYDMQPTFFAAEPIDDFVRLMPNNRLNIRVQSDGSRIEQADVLFINIASVYSVATSLGTDIPVGFNTNVRATISLNQSCPSPEVTPTLEGVINFKRFGGADAGRVQPDFRIIFDDHLQAAFTFHVVDVRAATIGGLGLVPIDPAVGGDISGYFDFIVRQGQRAQAYP
jgi:hypothetical protein